MAFNTLKTSLGFWLSILGKYSPFRFRKNSIVNIFNYLPINESITTSGQPTAEQFSLIGAEGFLSVINLAPHHAENALPDEPAVLANLGIAYTHIPVDFKNPTETDYQHFVAAMRAHTGAKVWVHCAANMRVSAFVYRYRIGELKEDRELARRDLEKIWQPFGVWKNFISKT